MLFYLIFVIAGYLFGSILFAPLFSRLIKNKDIVSNAKDHNPGVANAFQQAGILCGICALIADMGKAFLPVFFCLRLEASAFAELLWTPEVMLWGDRPEGICHLGRMLVLMAPVFGHIFPLYSQFRGGKGIAATFGCLLGYVPNLMPVLVLAFFFLLFSIIIRISPHFYRTIAAYIVTVGVFLVWAEMSLKLGFLLITILVCIRMHLSTEERGDCKVRLLWMH